MSFASWVVGQAMKGLDLVEMVAEQDYRRNQKAIERINDRIVVDKAFIDFARDVRISATQYVSEIEAIEEEKRELVAKAGTRLVESFPKRPRIKGWLSISLVSPMMHSVTGRQEQVTV